MSNCPNIKLSSGHEMPAFGLGTWLSKPGEVAAAVRHALHLGYTHFDCAQAYGNQAEIGEVFDEAFKSGKVKRDAVFITSKVWNVYHSAARATEAVDMILKDLRLDYIDMLLIHWPQGYKEDSGMFPKDDNGVMLYSEVDFVETWKSLEKAVDAGKVRSIGVSNFNTQQLQRVLDVASIKPSYLQIELHPYFAQHQLVNWCRERDIQVVAFSPLANNTHMFRKEGQPNLLEEPLLKDISAKHGKSPAQVALRWAIQRGLGVIPKSTSEKRLAENIDIFNFSLSDEEMKSIDTLDRGFRILVLERDLKHPHYPFALEF